MSSCKQLGKHMELYALIGIALIAVTLIHKKLTVKPCEPVVEVCPQPMDIDEDILECTPLQPPSPMSTSSSSFVIDDGYIK